MDGGHGQIMDDIFEAVDSMFIAIDRGDVEKCDISSTLDELNCLLIRKNIRKYKHMVTITFSGYEADPREVFEVPEIRQFMLALTQKFHFWFYFLNIENGSLMTVTACIYGAKQIDNGHLQFNNPQDLLNFYEYQLDTCRFLAKETPFTEEETRELEREVNLYYLGVPEVPPEKGISDKEECEQAIVSCKQGSVTADTLQILHKHEQENEDCLACLCDCYYYGWGVEKDYEKAVQYALAAKEKGSFNGIVYCSEWWERLRGIFDDAERGISEAEYKIGISYWYGCGVERDLEQATLWMKKAAMKKYHKAVEFIIAHGVLK